MHNIDDPDGFLTDDEREQLRAVVVRLGSTKAAARLRSNRDPVTRMVAGLRVHLGSVEVVRARLPAVAAEVLGPDADEQPVREARSA